MTIDQGYFEPVPGLPPESLTQKRIYISGKAKTIPKEELVSRLKQIGAIPEETFTKKGIDIFFRCDEVRDGNGRILGPGEKSRKHEKADRWLMPVLYESDFVARLEGEEQRMEN